MNDPSEFAERSGLAELKFTRVSAALMVSGHGGTGPLLTLHTDGRIEIHGQIMLFPHGGSEICEGFKPDAAAKQFWDAVAMVKKQMGIAQFCSKRGPPETTAPRYCALPSGHDGPCKWGRK